jgi:allantoin racemase
MDLIRVINPNSNPEVTQGLVESLAGFANPGRLEIACETLEEGPFGIESQQDVEEVVLPLLARMRERPAAAFVIACYSDPGLAVCREQIASPVFGIQESGIAMALTRGDRFGVIAIARGSIRRHLRAIRQMGVAGRLAGERALGMSVAESGAHDSFERLLATGRMLRDDDGADVLILGCAGMARHRGKLEAALDVPVVDPTQAAVAMAVGTVTPSNSSSRRPR